MAEATPGRNATSLSLLRPRGGEEGCETRGSELVGVGVTTGPPATGAQDLLPTPVPFRAPGTLTDPRGMVGRGSVCRIDGVEVTTPGERLQGPKEARRGP